MFCSQNPMFEALFVTTMLLYQLPVFFLSYPHVVFLKKIPEKKTTESCQVNRDKNPFIEYDAREKRLNQALGIAWDASVDDCFGVVPNTWGYNLINDDCMMISSEVILYYPWLCLNISYIYITLRIIAIHELWNPFLTSQHKETTKGFEHCFQLPILKHSCELKLFYLLGSKRIHNPVKQSCMIPIHQPWILIRQYPILFHWCSRPDVDSLRNFPGLKQQQWEHNQASYGHKNVYISPLIMSRGNWEDSLAIFCKNVFFIGDIDQKKGLVNHPPNFAMFIGGIV